jgi:tetratricopeptide (TPR) repeat protein
MGIKLMLVALFFALLTQVQPISVAFGAERDWAEWRAANTHYLVNELPETLNELFGHRQESASFYFNLGTVYLRLGKPGLALAHLEKAKQMQPREQDIQFNLDLAQQAAQKALSTDNLDPASTQLEQWTDRISLSEIQGVMNLLSLALTLTWLWHYLHDRRLKLALFKRSTYLLMIPFLLAFMLYWMKQGMFLHPAAIVVENQPIRSGPGSHYQPLREAETGLKVRVMARSANEEGTPESSVRWRQVRYAPHEVGWIQESSLLIL